MNELVEVRLWADNGPECECEWPVGLPRDYDELYRTHRKFVEKKVAAYNKVDRNFEDLLGEIWLRLINSDLLNKYVARTARMMRPNIYGKEAAALLGLTTDDWKIVLLLKDGTRSFKGQKPSEPTALTFQPVSGRLLDPEAVFSTEDIRMLDESLPDMKRPLPRRITWELQSLGFKAYLTQAIHNHFANWCRTRKRKYQDILLPSTAIVTTTDTGYVHTGHNYEATDWESRLVALTMADDDLLSVVETVEREFAAAGMDITTVTETVPEEYTDGEGRARVRQRPTERAVRGLELLDAVVDGRASHPEPHRKPRAVHDRRRSAVHEASNFGDGKTIREAVKVQQRAEIRIRARTAC